MKKSILVLFIILLSNNIAFSQWEKIYGENNITEHARNLVSLDDGYALLTLQDIHTWLLRTDLYGDTLWTKKYYDNKYNRLLKNGEEGFYLIDDSNNSNYSTIKITKTDRNGIIIWTKEFDKGQKIKRTKDNSFLILKRATSSSFELVKLMGNGNISWNRIFNIKNNYAWDASSIFIDNNHNILISISSNYQYSPAFPLNIFKTNMNGDSLWYNSFDSVAASSIYINEIDNGDYYFVGSSSRYKLGFDDKSYLLRLDSSGHKIQEDFYNTNKYSSQHSIDDSIFIKVLYEDSVIVKDNNEHNTIWEKDYSLVLNNSYHAPQFQCITEEGNYIFFKNDIEIGPLLIKVNQDGAFVWQKFLLNKSTDWITGVTTIPLNENEFILSGTLNASTGNSDIIIKNVFAPTKVNLILYPQYPKDININTEDSIFSTPIDVKIISNIFNSDIYYTLDGSTPTIHSLHYTQPIRIDSTTTIKVIGIANGYEDSDVITKDYQFYQKFKVGLQNNYTGVDSNFIGSARVNISLPAIVPSLGEVLSLKWLLNNKIIGEGNDLSYDFPTGTNTLILKTTGNWGNIQYDTAEVNIYSSRYITHNFSDKINEYITPPSELKEGFFVLSNFDFALYDNDDVIIDSLFNVVWKSKFSKKSSTSCIINENNFLFNYGSAFLLFSNTDSTDFSLNTFAKISNTSINISPSYSYDSLIYIGTKTGKVVTRHLQTPKENFWEFDCGSKISTQLIINKNNDVIFGCKNNNLYSVNSTGTLNWKYSVDSEIESTPALGKDSSIIFGANNGFLYKITQDGKELWKFQTDGAIKSSPVIDYFGNIYFGSSDGNFYSLNPNGELNWKYKSKTNIEGNASIGSNGLIYVNTEKNALYVFNKEGEIKWHFKFSVSTQKTWDGFTEQLFDAPLITNNNLILLRTNFDKYYILKDSIFQNSSQTLLPQWPTYKGSNLRTGRVSVNSLTSVEKDPNKNINNYMLSQNYPNPFNPATTIKYAIPNKSNVIIRVYDILGNVITTLVDKLQNAGNYKIVFNAKNLTSGIYFYQIKAGKYTQVRKMILLK